MRTRAPPPPPPRVISYVVSAIGRTPPSYSDGVFTVGSRPSGEVLGSFTATVPVRVASDAVVNEQCLTVTASGNPPPGLGTYNDDILDNVKTVCLGQMDRKVVFSDGTADLWALYPCVGETAPLCDDTASVVQAVKGLTAGQIAGFHYEYFEPESVVVHIPDRVGRNTSGGSLWWNNGHDIG